MKIKTKSPILNIHFNDEEFLLVTQEETYIYNLPIQHQGPIILTTFENPEGLVAISHETSSKFAILG